MKTILSLLVIFFVCGCATRVEVEKKVFHTLDGTNFSGKTFIVGTADPALSNNLEFRNYTDLIAKYLTSKGMKRIPVSEIEKSDFSVFYSFAMTSSQEVGSVSVPHFTTTGGTSNFNATTYSSSGSYNTYGTVSSFPTLQYAGSSTNVYTYTNYIREFKIIIYSTSNFKNGDKTPVYQSTVHSEGSSRDTVRLIPIFINALLLDFPSVSGKSEMFECEF